MAISIVREERILKHGSPYYLVTCGAIAANAFEVYDLKRISEDAPKYAPLDFVEVSNLDDTSAVSVQFDSMDTMIVPAGAIRKVEQKPYRRLSIRNVGASTIAAGKVTFLARRQPITVDTYIRRFKLR